MGCEGREEAQGGGAGQGSHRNLEAEPFRNSPGLRGIGGQSREPLLPPPAASAKEHLNCASSAYEDMLSIEPLPHQATDNVFARK